MTTAKRGIDETQPLIGLLVSAGARFVVGALGIMDAGAVIVPLDCRLPIDDLLWRIESCGISVLVTEASQRYLIVNLARRAAGLRRVLFLDEMPGDMPALEDLDCSVVCRPRRITRAATFIDGRHDREWIYVMHTSGSSGPPKGVIVSHRNMVPLLTWSLAAMSLGEETRSLLTLNPCFDFGLYDILVTLAAGGCLYVTPASDADAPSETAAYIAAHAINTLHCVPEFACKLFREGLRFESLTCVHIGGDRLTREVIERVYESTSAKTVIFHGYGPTETTVNATMARIGSSGEYAADFAVAPIGIATGEQRVLILDDSLNVVPTGFPGEIYIAGVSVSDGYLGSPASTASAFMPAADGERMYRTGDLGRRRRDAQIEFLGRRDDQIKWKGHRIEPGQIETALRSCAAVCEAKVVLDRGTGLVAYIMLRDERVLADDLIDHLCDRLPVFMIPRRYMRAPKFPVTANGKLDLTALANISVPMEARVHDAGESVEVDDRLAKIWQKALKVSTIGELDDFFLSGGDSMIAANIVAHTNKHFNCRLHVRQLFEARTLRNWHALATNPSNQRPEPRTTVPRDSMVAIAAVSHVAAASGESFTPSIAASNPILHVEQMMAALFKRDDSLEGENFFTLGGDSMLATRLTAQLRSTFHLELSIRDIFENPTARQLAARIEQLRGDRSEETEPSDHFVVDQFPIYVPASFAQESMWFIEKLSLVGPAYHIATLLGLEGRLDSIALEQCLGEIVRRHESLRTRFEERDGVPFQVVEPPAGLPVQIIDLTALPQGAREPEAYRIARDEVGRVFDLERGPLMRAVLMRLDTAHHVLLITVHHIVCDGWSMNILTRELSELYSVFGRAGTPPAAVQDAQYRHFCSWQRRASQTDAFRAQLDYWKRRLSGLPRMLLKTDRARPTTQSFRGARSRLRLSRTVTAAVAQFAQQRRATTFMVLLAALDLLLARQSGQVDICVGTPVSGRDRPAFESIVGCLVNTLVLRTDLSGDPTFNQLLDRVRETTLGAYANAWVPVQRLMVELRPLRASSATPLFQVFFSLQNFEQQPLQLAGITLRGMEWDGGAQFDLSLHLFTHGHEISGFFEFATDLFEPATVDKLGAEWVELLASAIENPDISLSQVHTPVAEPRQRRNI